MVARGAFGAALAAVLLLAVWRASPAQTPEPAPEATFKSSSNLVVIPVSVTDSANRFVLDLEKKDFQIFEDGVEQTIAHFSGEEAPLSVGLAFDESGSMDLKLRRSRDAVTEFLRTMNGEDETFLVEFNEKAKVSVPFTSKPPQIESALASSQPGGLTAMLDAVDTSLREMKKAKNPRKAIVIISDGGDNSSHYTAQQIESLVREADVEVYAMGVFEPVFGLALSSEEISGPKLLSELANQTGGRAFSATLSSDLPAVAARIAIELRNQYVLAYYPRNQEHDGKYHKVEVKVAQPKGISALKAHWRTGYYAPAD